MSTSSSTTVTILASILSGMAGVIVIIGSLTVIRICYKRRQLSSKLKPLQLPLHCKEKSFQSFQGTCSSEIASTFRQSQEKREFLMKQNNRQAQMIELPSPRLHPVRSETTSRSSWERSNSMTSFSSTSSLHSAGPNRIFICRVSDVDSERTMINTPDLSYRDFSTSTTKNVNGSSRANVGNNNNNSSGSRNSSDSKISNTNDTKLIHKNSAETLIDKKKLKFYSTNMTPQPSPTSILSAATLSGSMLSSCWDPKDDAEPGCAQAYTCTEQPAKPAKRWTSNNTLMEGINLVPPPPIYFKSSHRRNQRRHYAVVA